MRTIIPFSSLENDSWAEDFTASQECRQHFMYIQCMGHYKAGPEYGVYKRKNLHSYLLLFTSHGEGVINYLGKELSIPEGFATIIHCSVEHSYYCAPGNIWYFRWIHFSGECLSGYLSDYMNNWGVTSLSCGSERIQDIYRKATSNELADNIEVSTTLISICSEMLVNLMRNKAESGKKLSPVIRSAIDIFEEEFSTNLDLDYICQRLCISKYYFSRTFHEQTGYSPNEYLITIRLNNAKSLLRSSTETIDEIACKCGFSTSTYFIQAFKKREGMTPKQYRKFFLQISLE